MCPLDAAEKPTAVNQLAAYAASYWHQRRWFKIYCSFKRDHHSKEQQAQPLSQREMETLCALPSADVQIT